MMARRVSRGLWLGAVLIVCVAGATADQTSGLQKRFDHETNPVHRAKLLEKLGDAQFDDARRAFKANDFATVGIVLEKYRDNVRVALDGLKKKHIDAETDSNGFRHLEIHVRRGIREADEILLMVPDQYQPPLQIVRTDLDAMDRELIRMLFRHREQQPATSPQTGPPGPSEEKP
jgi:succinate dehydrogenase flavin-adding protein (antitoxin of CptAB toxin-antitoxin module)